jgi:hypothetical protein
LENIKNIVSIYTKTQSGDEDLLMYLNIRDTYDIIEKLKEDFGDEFAYIDMILTNCYDIIIDTSLIYKEIKYCLENLEY